MSTGPTLRRSALGVLAFFMAFGAAASAQAETVTFPFTGAEQTFVVPAGVTSVNVTAVGARGGRGDQNFSQPVQSGGTGAIATGDLSVTPGQVLFIQVGGIGSDATGVAGPVVGGFNGGGNGSARASQGGAGGAGGGATDVRTVSRFSPGTLDSRLIVAGGGGGSGAQASITAGVAGAGGAAGATGAAGQDGEDTGGNGGAAGQGGTASAGGGAGAGGDANGSPGTPGALGVGGSGGAGAPSGGGAGGGGGGGLFGGGGGGGGASGGGVAPGAGGGGGSSGFAPGVTGTSVTAAAFTDPPGVTIEFTPAPETNLTGTPKAKLKANRKAKATFAFSSPAAGSTFECRLDGGPFEACTSPATFRVGKGKHSFAVRAVIAGAADPSPATFDFRVKKKRRR